MSSFFHFFHVVGHLAQDLLELGRFLLLLHDLGPQRGGLFLGLPSLALEKRVLSQQALEVSLHLPRADFEAQGFSFHFGQPCVALLYLSVLYFILLGQLSHLAFELGPVVLAEDESALKLPQVAVVMEFLGKEGGGELVEAGDDVEELGEEDGEFAVERLEELEAALF